MAAVNLPERWRQRDVAASSVDAASVIVAKIAGQWPSLAAYNTTPRPGTVWHAHAGTPAMTTHSSQHVCLSHTDIESK